MKYNEQPIKLKLVVKFTIALIFLSVFHVFSQQKKFTGNPDTAFKVARELAFNKHRKQAQDTLLLILTKYPNYNDIRAFLASTYSWDGNYNKARKEFMNVLNKDPKRKTTWIAAINNELWSESPFKALELTTSALKHFPNNEEILLLKAKAQQNGKNPEDALETVQEVLLNSPKNSKAIEYKKGLIDALSYNTIGLKSSVDLYSDVFDPMQLHTLKYSRQTKYGSIIVKMNFNRRFQENGVQFEVDLYPRIANGLYAYVNLGFANTFLFPDVRYGAELYKSLPKSFEISAGFRALKYSSTTTIYTGSIAWYTGNSYWAFRTYITPNNSGSSKSGILNYRKYRNDANNYFSVSVGMGYSPEIDRFNFNGNENAIVKLNSQKFGGGYYFSSKNNKNLWGSTLGITHQEISFDPGNYFWIYSLSISWEVKFR
ncbi:YaiO family outer membrane beta-barrel protein [Lutibacter sp.]|uniref:YaiO family outer membrane beta-barrel protein n=1 Tax=Lutibacter sp. TaxID=1925666 RepID=UPI0025BDE936|nr:YaiO family outer membrane beta-barrel protein [Lutibacter sp.]MCF6180483.1 YaiO family outer membrane beta-barrel protein [Lutibacter sp.]